MLGIFSGNRPDLTPAQIVAGIPIVAELGHAFGVFNLTQPQQDSLGKAVTYSFVLLGADVGLRAVRNLKDAKVQAKAFESPLQAPDVAHADVYVDGEPVVDREVDEIGEADLPSDDEEAQPQIVQPSQQGD